MRFNWGTKLKAFMENAKHVMHISYKPNVQEFSKTAKVIILGILIIGVLGFLISIVVSFISGASI